ncbi:MAG: hypothetical protein IPJ69_12665 [Deltaproteobacteria bacterium]|nr:MAG: hypothetical protein IPJ69_12665 [Deltaproteobacteria bacterium]
MRNFHFSKGEVVREPVYLEAVNEIVLEEKCRRYCGRAKFQNIFITAAYSDEHHDSIS